LVDKQVAAKFTAWTKVGEVSLDSSILVTGEQASFYANCYITKGSGKVRLYEIKTATVLAEITGITNPTPDLLSTVFTNYPSGLSAVEIHVAVDVADGRIIYVDSAFMEIYPVRS